MSRGVARQRIFFADSDRTLFGRLLGDVHERHGAVTHAYCLMDNHFHLLLHCPDGGLSEAMHHLLSVFARRVNRRVERWGHLFGSRFTARLLTTTEYIANVVRYIHCNPLDIAGVDDPRAYRWSSHRHYLGLRRCPEWLSLEPVCTWFRDADSFHAFVAGGSRDLRGPRPTSSRRPEPSIVFDAVELVSNERSDAPPRHLPAQRRAVTLNLVGSLPAELSQAVLDDLGLRPGTATMRSAFSRARALTRAEPEVDDMTRRVATLLGVEPTPGGGTSPVTP